MGGRRAGDVTAIYANPIKAKEKLGWATTRSLKTCLADAWHWQQRLSQSLIAASPDGSQPIQPHSTTARIKAWPTKKPKASSFGVWTPSLIRDQPTAPANKNPSGKPRFEAEPVKMIEGPHCPKSPSVGQQMHAHFEVPVHENGHHQRRHHRHDQTQDFRVANRPRDG